MKNQVTITSNPETGSVFTPNAKLGKDGKAYGFIRVESTTIDWSQPVARVKTRSALKTILASDFAKMSGELGAGSKIDGKIIRKDSLVAQYEGQKALQVPVRDAKNNIIDGEFRAVTSNGVAVYRQDIFTNNENDKDELVSYDKVSVSAPAATKLA